MKKLPTHSRSRPSLDPQGKLTERHNEQIRELSHTLANRLTVINLCCFNLRKLLSRRQGSAVRSELDRIEAAVKQAAKVVQTLNEKLQNRRPPLVRDLPIDKQSELGISAASEPNSRARQNSCAELKRPGDETFFA